MNILLSLLIYNPIEAYTLVLLCGIITGNDFKFNLKAIIYLYLFSTVNFINQIIPYFWYGSIIYAILNVVTGCIVTPILLKLFLSKVFYYIPLRECFMAQFTSCIFIITISVILDIIFGTNNVFYNNDNLSEFIVNLVIFSVQISLYKIIEYRRNIYEKFCKGNRK